MSWKNLDTFSPHPTPSIFQGMQAELQLFWWAFMFVGAASPFPGAAKVFEVSLPNDQEFMSLSSTFDLYLEKKKQSPNAKSETHCYFQAPAEAWCSDFNCKSTPGFYSSDLVALTYSEARGLPW